MAMGFLEILILIMMNGGGGSDLLDYVPADFYWEQHSVLAVTPEAMMNVLADDDADDIDRLMAIRTLGELGDESALAVLGPLVDSNAPFVGNYARRSIAWLSGVDPEPASAVTLDQLDADLALLPAEMMIVAQSRGITTVSGPMDLSTLVPDMEAMGGPSPEEYTQEIAAGLLEVIGQIGNVRLDALTFAMAFEEDDDEPTMIMVVARGLYDRERVADMVADEGGAEWDQFTIGEIEVLQNATDWGEKSVVLMPSDEQVVFMFAMGDERQPPLDEVAMLLEEGETEPALGGMLLDQLDAIDRDAASIWMVMEVPAMLKVNEPAEVFGAFDAMRFVGGPTDAGGFYISGVAQGTDADAVATTHGVIQGYIVEGITELEEELQFDPGMRPMFEPMIEMLRSIELHAQGDTLTCELELESGPGQLLQMFFGVSVAR
ncbi:MAG: hypothetical protein ACIAXF_03275 [Phycisphaerales bacterium JB063]